MTQQMSGITAPHDHDVLSGRGNFVNYHAGNEHFRALVRKHKLEYVKCPKPQKGKFSRMIFDEIKARNPPGRFLKQDMQTKLWYDIGEKKALDKTRQALREGAPEIVKEITGDEDDIEGDDNGMSVQKDALNRGGGAGGFHGDMPMHPFLANNGISSPVMSRNTILTSPGLASPGMMSPGMMLGQLSPDMGQFSGTRVGGRGARLLDPSALPGPPLQSMDPMGQMTAQQQAAMMLNAQMGNNFSNSNLGGSAGAAMLSPQQNQLQSQMNAQQLAMNAQQLAMSQMSQQIQQQQQQLASNQNAYAELQMLQNKLQNLQRQNLTSPTMNAQSIMQANNSQFTHRSMDQMPPPLPINADASFQRQRNSSNNPDFAGSSKLLPQGARVEPLGGTNPRRMPPPSLMKREDSSNSIKIDKIFSNSPASTKKKYDGNGSHISAMSLSLGDMQEEGNLSAVFDSSLRISTSSKHTTDVVVSKEKLKDRSSNTSWDPNSLEMSVGNSMGNMSYATLGESNMQQSEGNMSFSKVFEEPDKNG